MKCSICYKEVNSRRVTKGGNMCKYCFSKFKGMIGSDFINYMESASKKRKRILRDIKLAELGIY